MSSHVLRIAHPTLYELPRIYDDVPQGIHPVARRSLHAHLLKLQRDGRAAETDGAWRLR